MLATEAVPTRPKENPHPEVLSALRFPDWVENAIREEKRQEAAINQYCRIEEAELRNWNKLGDLYGNFADNDEIPDWMLGADDDDEVQAYTAELNRLLEANVDIEV